MRLAQLVSITFIGLIFIAIVGLLSPVNAKEPTKTLEAKCTSKDFTNLYCNLRTSDDKIYFNGKWHSKYVINHTIYVNDELHIILLEKEK